MQSMTAYFVISRSPVQVWSPAPSLFNHLQRSVATAISSAVAILVLSATPAAAQSQPTRLVFPAITLTTVQGLDVATTYRARSSGNGREANPLMDVSTGGQVAIKAGVTLGAILGARLVEKRGHPRVAKVMLYSMSAVVAGVAVHNESIARRR